MGGATSFVVAVASEHKRWSNTKSADTSLSGVVRSGANNADAAATTTLASDPAPQQQKIKFCPIGISVLHMIKTDCEHNCNTNMVRFAFDQQPHSNHHI